MEITDELVQKIFEDKLNTKCPRDQTLLHRGFATEPVGGGSYEEYTCSTCATSYTAGAVYRAAMGEPEFLERQAQERRRY